jgi:hypothetical protein
MKKWLIPVLVILAVVFGFYNFTKGFNNTAIELNENVAESWANVETSYQRRTDLIRYNYFTSETYLWPFKGDSKNGVGVDAFRNLFPLPNNIITTNPNLIQNPGY